RLELLAQGVEPGLQGAVADRSDPDGADLVPALLLVDRERSLDPDGHAVPENVQEVARHVIAEQDDVDLAGGVLEREVDVAAGVRSLVPGHLPLEHEALERSFQGLPDGSRELADGEDAIRMSRERK